MSSVTFAIPSKPWRKRFNGEVDEYEVSVVVVAKTAEVNAIRLDGVKFSSWSAVDDTYSVTRQLVRICKLLSYQSN